MRAFDTRHGIGTVVALLWLACAGVARAQVTITPAPVPSCVASDTLVYNGASWECAATGLLLPISDASNLLKDNADATKIGRFELSPVTTGNTRIIYWPNCNLDLSVTTANYVLATGSAGVGCVSLRALVAADIPSIDGSKITGAASVAWANVSKSGSSLADLVTRAVANLSDGSNVALLNGNNAFTGAGTTSFAAATVTFGASGVVMNYPGAGGPNFDFNGTLTWRNYATAATAASLGATGLLTLPAANAVLFSNATPVVNAPNGVLYFDTEGVTWRKYSNAASLAILANTGAWRWPTYGAGTATFDASGNITSVSDERMKDIQGSFTPGLTAVLGIKPIRYRYTAASGLDDENIYAGFSAQNVMGFIPEAVGKNLDGLYSLNIVPVLAATVTAVQELAREVDELRAVSGLPAKNRVVAPVAGEQRIVNSATPKRLAEIAKQKAEADAAKVKEIIK